MHKATPMQLEIVEVSPTAATYKPTAHREWDIRDKTGRSVATSKDAEFTAFVKFFADLHNSVLEAREGNFSVEDTAKRLGIPEDTAYSPSQYIQDAVRTESRLPSNSPEHDLALRLLHVGMGLCTEAGEFMDQMKRFNFYGKDIDLGNLDEEVGDVLWYLAIYMAVRGKTFEQIMLQNIRKLRARYPEKFTSDKALHRDLTAEQSALYADNDE
jgi:NTP pyrophosphatase (non-canonical NTP hydrolase)